MRILFMGTPDFAVPCFDILNKEYDIIGFVKRNWDDLMENSIFVDRRAENVRLDKIIKSIYEIWNLQ